MNAFEAFTEDFGSELGIIMPDIDTIPLEPFDLFDIDGDLTQIDV